MNTKPKVFTKKKRKKYLQALRLGKNFLDITQKHDAKRKKKINLDFIKMYNLCSANNSLKRVRRQITDWKTIFANVISEKGLIYSIYKELSKLNS